MNNKYSVMVDLTEMGEDYFSIVGSVTEHWWANLKACLRSVKGWLETPDYYSCISIIDILI